MQVVTAVKDFFQLPGDSKHFQKKGNGAPGNGKGNLARYRSPKLVVKELLHVKQHSVTVTLILSLMILDLEKTSIFDITLKTNCRNYQLIVFIYFKFNLKFGKGRLS